jgi:hypothetical protein
VGGAACGCCVASATYHDDTRISRFPLMSVRSLPQTLDFHNWLGVFRASTPTFVHHALTCTSSGVPEEEREAAATAFEKTFLHVLDQLQEKPWRSDLEYPLVQPLTCLTLCSIR